VTGLLSDLVVIDLTRALAGPHAGLMLADLGARVIKVESHDGDDSRGWGPPYAGDPAQRRSTYFMSANRNKESVVADLKSEDGKDFLRRLVRRLPRGARVINVDWSEESEFGPPPKRRVPRARFLRDARRAGLTLVAGAIWGRITWGVYWTWDARLTLTLFLWFIFVAYIVLRGAIDEREMRARYCAVLGILGALLVPFIHLSVYLFRTLHPKPILMKPDAPSLPTEMLTTVLLAFAAFTLLYVALLRVRYRYAFDRDALLAESSNAR